MQNPILRELNPRWMAGDEFFGTGDQLLFSIGQNRDLLRRLLKEHVTDATREQLAKRVVDHLELSGFEIDEARQVMMKRPGHHGHG
jgi:hypothetical protein